MPLPKYPGDRSFGRREQGVWPEKALSTAIMTKEWQFVVVWEFRVRPEAVERFQHVYGADGAWASLFAKSADYVGTELVRNPTDPLLFRTHDYWISENAYDRFRHQHAGEYKAIDELCEAMTETETEIGRFDRDDFKPG